MATGRTRVFRASSPAFSTDGSTLAWIATEGSAAAVRVIPFGAGGEPVVAVTTEHPTAQMSSQACAASPELQSLVLAPSGHQVALQVMLREGWELFLVGSDGTG